jgi:energy-coupling factor transporter ATP-binding protein EcfA2
MRWFNLPHRVGNIITELFLQYTYPDGTSALRGVSFHFTHGEAVGVIGAGKSTLLLHLNGCLLPQTGTVRIGGLPLIFVPRKSWQNAPPRWDPTKNFKPIFDREIGTRRGQSHGQTREHVQARLQDGPKKA